MTPSREEVIAAARKAWGPENPKFSKKDELRWGNNGAKCLDLNDFVWVDHDPAAPVKGGGWTDLFKMAGVKFNGHDDEWGAEIVYQYRDKNLKLLFEVVRRPGHKFLQRHYDENGEKIWNMKGVKRVLYRLPQLVGSDAQTDIVYIVEGEKDADNLAKLGFVTTTNPGGAGKWREEYNEELRERDVVILPDNDEAGRKHAEVVEHLLSNVVNSLKVVTLPGLKEKGDVSDWIAAGRTADDLRMLVEAAPDRKHKANGATGIDWLGMCQKTGSGEPLGNVSNALISLRNDAPLKDLLIYDLLLRHPMVVRSEPMPMSPEDITDIQERMQLAGLRRMGKDVCLQAIMRRAKENSYHPLLDAWNKLEWDGIERVATFASEYLGCKAGNNNYSNLVCAMFLRQMVKRIYEPGCKADYMLILEGEQGLEKSKACEILAGGPKYFSDGCPDLDKGKEVSQHLRGKILIEFSEMNLYSRADINHHKEFLSRTHERYRPPYEPAEVDEPRQCTFIGTSNKSVYLRDETGNRRYWGIAVGKIQTAKLIADRDQIIAEAIDDYRRNLPTYPDEDTQRDTIEPEQENRYEDDPWTDKVSEYLNGVTRTTIAAIATSSSGLDMPIERVTGMVQSRISRILRKFKWISKRDKNSRWWEPMNNGE